MTVDLKEALKLLPGARRVTVKIVGRDGDAAIFNAEGWLAAAIEAMLQQDETPFEAALDDAQAPEELQQACEEGAGEAAEVFRDVDDEPRED